MMARGPHEDARASKCGSTAGPGILLIAAEARGPSQMRGPLHERSFAPPRPPHYHTNGNGSGDRTWRSKKTSGPEGKATEVPRTDHMVWYRTGPAALTRSVHYSFADNRQSTLDRHFDQVIAFRPNELSLDCLASLLVPASKSVRTSQ